MRKKGADEKEVFLLVFCSLFSPFFVPCFSLLVLLSKGKYAILNMSFDGEFVTILTETVFYGFSIKLRRKPK